MARGIPFLGICFGAQLIAAAAGGGVTDTDRSYLGWMENDEIEAPVWKGPWFRFHKAQCHPPPSAVVLARSHGIVQAFQCGSAVGVQFHPEMDLASLQAVLPVMRRDFGLTSMDADTLVEETRFKLEALSPSRNALFEEILTRCLGSASGPLAVLE